jgi:hypothetical protein
VGRKLCDKNKKSFNKFCRVRQWHQRRRGHPRASEHQQRNISAGRALAAASAPYHLYIYETNTHTPSGSLSLLFLFICAAMSASPSSSLAFFALALLLGIFVMEAGAPPSLARCLCFLNKPKFIEKRAPTTLFSQCVCWKNARRQRFCVGCNAKWRR